MTYRINSYEELIYLFWSRVNCLNNGCWEWTAALGHGYGHFAYQGKKHYAHKFAYESINNTTIKNKEIHHLCKNRKCVNPDHLEILTKKEHQIKENPLIIKQMLKTHCPQGHPYDLFNTQFRRGSRQCRICTLNRKREWYRKKSVNG